MGTDFLTDSMEQTMKIKFRIEWSDEDKDAFIMIFGSKDDPDEVSLFYSFIGDAELEINHWNHKNPLQQKEERIMKRLKL